MPGVLLSSLLWLTSGGARAQDLVVDGTTVTLSGVQAYDEVRIVNGGVLKVEPYDGSAGSGTLELSAVSVLVDATSRIVATGAGYTGTTSGAGNGPGGGGSSAAAGGGGGHGGSGASGGSPDCATDAGAGGGGYGAIDRLADLGSAGGAPGGSGISGGIGGGAVLIDAAVIDVRGRIEADGLDGGVAGNGEGAGGGAGGGIVLLANQLYCSGVLSARGGSGGAGLAGQGGGGAGGRVEQWSDEVHEPCTVRVEGGLSGCGDLGGIGADDAIADDDYDGDGVTFTAGDCDAADPDTGPYAAEVCDARDNDCDGGVDEMGCAGCSRRDPFDYVYQFCTTAVDWATAQADCADWGYHLADVADSSEDGTLTSNANAVDRNEYWWIGANDLANEDTFVWESGQPFGYEDFSSFDENENDQDCVTLRGQSGTWYVRDCDEAWFYACETCQDPLWFPDDDGDGHGDRTRPVVDCTLGEPAYQRSPTDCDDGRQDVSPSETTDPCNGVDDDCDGVADEGCACQARSYGGHDYLFCTTTAPRDAALAHCERQGMTLATIDDPAENAWMDGAADALSTQPWTVGLSDREVEGLFTWEFGTSAYRAFGAGQPDNAPNGADCVVLNGGGAAGAWADDDCATPRRFVCETIEGCSTTVWHPDADVDQYGSDTIAFAACAQPDGWIAAAGDCDDGNTNVHPGAVEGVADGVDQDCDGGDLCRNDGDRDGYGTTAIVASADLDCADPGESSRTDDCDDAVDTTWPGAPESCGDGVDSDCDGAGGPASDEDGDGLPWSVEGPVGGHDCLVDTDGDGLDDPFEHPRGDSDGDEIWDLADPDDDNDAIGTLVEGLGAGEEQNGCANGDDGVPNYLDDDSDGDGIPDLEEGDADADDDEIPNFLDCSDDCETDEDGDGLLVCDETALGLDPRSADSDGDGARDPDELGSFDNPRDTDGDRVIDPLDEDDDGDLVPSRAEDRDADGTPMNDDTDGDETWDFRDDDDDGDRVPTRDEDRDGDGDPRTDDSDGDAIADYLDPLDHDGPAGDPDGDGLPNQLETDLGSDPLHPDSDDDGLTDGIEVGDPAAPPDHDGDGLLDLVDPDDDDDGVPTRVEGAGDIDGDDLPNHLDPDADGDGLSDAEEGVADRDCDGVYDLLDAEAVDRCGEARDGDGAYTPGPGACGGCAAGRAGGPGAAALVAAVLVALRRRRRREAA